MHLGTHAVIYYGLACICHRSNDPEELCHQLCSLKVNDNANILLYRGASTPELMNFASWEHECSSYFERFFSERLNDVICLPQHGDSFIRTLEEWCCDSKKNGKKGALIIRNIDLLRQISYFGIQKTEFIDWGKASCYLVYNYTENIILYLQLVKDINSKKNLDKEIKHCRSNIHLLINLYRKELENSGVTIVGIIITNSETGNLKLNCDLCSIFVVSMKTFENFDSCKSWWNTNSGWLKVDDLDQNQKEKCFSSFCSKMLGLVACTNCTYLPNFTKCFASQINQACLFLTPEQVEVIYYSNNRTILKGDFGTGKSIVLQKKLENLAKTISEDEVIYYINYDGKSNVFLGVKNFVEKTFPNNFHKIQIRKNTSKQKLSSFFLSISNEVDKRINSVHIFIDEYSGEDLTAVEVKILKEKLHEKHFEHSVIFIAAQPIEKQRTHTFQYSGKKQTSDINLFDKLEEVFEIRELTRVMRNTVEIYNVAKIVQKYLKDKKNEFIHYQPRVRQTSDTAQRANQGTSKMRKKNFIKKLFGKYLDFRKKGIVKEIAPEDGTRKNLIQESEEEQVIKSPTNLIINDLDQAHKLVDNINVNTDENVGELKITSSYTFCESRIGHDIKSQNPKLVSPHQFESFFENMISYAAVLDSLEIQKRRTVIIHFEQLPPTILVKAFEMLSIPVLDDVEIFMSSKGNPALITNFQYIRGMEFENVIVLVDPDEYYLKQYFPEAITRCTTNLCLMLLEDKKKKKKEETVKGMAERLEECDPIVVEKLIIEKCKECDIHSNFYCYKNNGKPKRIGINELSQQFKELEKSFDSVWSSEEDATSSIAASKQT